MIGKFVYLLAYLFVFLLIQFEVMLIMMLQPGPRWAPRTYMTGRKDPEEDLFGSHGK